ncbi:MAG: hypothetical protein K2Q09_02055, partial [Phycisphaerales bacterium]|nr:hypothetical protein [Phycisphaerales bacterium]
MTLHTPNPLGPTPAPRASGGVDALWIVRSPAQAWSVLVLLTLALALGLVMHLAGREPRLATGVIADSARVVRAPFTIEDRAGTESRRQAARLRAPRVYVAEAARFEELMSGLENLPRALADATDLSRVDAAVRDRFGITADTLGTLRQIAHDAGESARWTDRTGRLITLLRATPVVEGQSYQREAVS